MTTNHIIEIVKNEVQNIHNSLLNLKLGGTTMTLVILILRMNGLEILTANLGDSKAFLINN